MDIKHIQIRLFDIITGAPLMMRFCVQVVFGAKAEALALSSTRAGSQGFSLYLTWI
jgi:hypothetical protein